METLNDKLTRIALQRLKEDKKVSKFSSLQPNKYKMTLKLEKMIYNDFVQQFPRINQEKARNIPKVYENVKRRSIMKIETESKHNLDTEESQELDLLSNAPVTQRSKSTNNQQNLAQQQSLFSQRKQTVMVLNSKGMQVRESQYLLEKSYQAKQARYEIQNKIQNLMKTLKQVKKNDPLRNIPKISKSHEYYFNIRSQCSTQSNSPEDSYQMIKSAFLEQSPDTILLDDPINFQDDVDADDQEELDDFQLEKHDSHLIESYIPQEEKNQSNLGKNNQSFSSNDNSMNQSLPLQQQYQKQKTASFSLPPIRKKQLTTVVESPTKRLKTILENKKEEIQQMRERETQNRQQTFFRNKNVTSVQQQQENEQEDDPKFKRKGFVIKTLIRSKKFTDYVNKNRNIQKQKEMDPTYLKKQNKEDEDEEDTMTEGLPEYDDEEQILDSYDRILMNNENSVPKYMDTDEVLSNFKLTLIKLIKTDKGLKNLIRYYSTEKKFMMFIFDTFKFSYYTILNPEELENAGKFKWPKICVSEMLRQRFSAEITKFLQNYHMPKDKYMKILDKMNDIWLEVMKGISVLEEMGGENVVDIIATGMCDQISAQYKFDGTPHLPKLKEALCYLFNPKHEENMLKLGVICTNLKQKNQDLCNEDLYFFKKLLFDQMANIQHLSIETRIRAIKFFEKVRYQEFRHIYGMAYVENDQIALTILKMIRTRKMILQYFGQIEKKRVYNFVQNLVECIFGFGSVKSTADNLKQICKQHIPDENLVQMIENCFVQTIKIFGEIHQTVLAEVQNKFFWLRVKLGMRKDFYTMTSKVNFIVQKLYEWVQTKIRNQSINNLDVEQVQQTKALKFILTTCFTGSFSVQDVKPIMKITGLSKDVFLFWLNGIKRALLASTHLKAEQIVDIDTFLTKSFNSGL